MKKIIALLVLMSVSLFACAVQSTETDNLNWLTNLEEAQKIAQTENRTILVNFTGSDWCVWCFRLTGEVFSREEFEKYAAENLVLVKVDFPKNKNLVTKDQAMYNQALSQKYGIRGFPTILLFDKDLMKIGQTGYQEGGPVKYIEHLKSFMK